VITVWDIVFSGFVRGPCVNRHWFINSFT